MRPDAVPAAKKPEPPPAQEAQALVEENLGDGEIEVETVAEVQEAQEEDSVDVDAGGGDDGVDGAPGGDTSSNRGRSRSSARRGVGGAHAGRGASPSLLNTVAKLYNGRAKGGILNALRSYTTGSDPAANRDSKEGKRRRENEVRSLQHGTGKLLEGFIIDLAATRGTAPEVQVGTSAWSKQGASGVAMCKRRGIFADDTRTTCTCAALFAPPLCEEGAVFTRARTMMGWKGPYQGPLLAAVNTLPKGTEIRVAKDPSGPHVNDFRPQLLSKVGPNLQQLLPTADPLQGHLLRSCAVVGNGAILHLGLSRGKLIDSHAAVFRVNNAPTEGYERHVGKRTTFRVLGNEDRIFAWREDLQEMSVQIVRSAADFRAFLFLKRRMRGLRLSMMHHEYMKFLDDTLGFMPSTGLYAVLMAMHRCVRVSLFGFQATGTAFRTLTGGRYRYFDTHTRAVDPTRDGEEWLVLEAFHQAGLLQFGDPCITECHTATAAAPVTAACRRCMRKSYS
eukprot:jgi/Tetstr1/455044/TSEL_041900.t1